MKKSISVLMAFCLILMLSACGKKVEEQIDDGLKNFETIFQGEPKGINKSINNLELFLPSRYSIKTTDELNNFLINKGDEVYILFVNPTDEQGSKLHYNLLKQDTSKNIIKEKTLEADNKFSFAAVVKQSEEKYELIVSSGKIKMTTITKAKHIDDKLQNMMNIVHSVQLIEN